MNCLKRDCANRQEQVKASGGDFFANGIGGADITFGVITSNLQPLAVGIPALG